MDVLWGGQWLLEAPWLRPEWGTYIYTYERSLVYPDSGHEGIQVLENLSGLPVMLI